MLHKSINVELKKIDDVTLPIKKIANILHKRK